MATLRLLTVAAVSLVLLEACRGADGPSDVVVLTPDNFDDYVGKDKAAFVEFYAPWCGHCKKLAPEYEKFGTAFKKADVVIGKVDCDAHKELCGKYDVSGYPSLKWFPANEAKPEGYQGGRELEDLVSFVNEKIGTKVKIPVVPSDVVVLTPSNFDSVALHPSKDVLIEFYAPWCGHCKSLAPTYEKLGTVFKSEKSVVIAKCDADAHRELGEKFGVSGFPTIKWFPKGNKEGESYDGGRDLGSFVEFINANSGTARTTSGTLSNKAGLIEALDELASSFADSSDQAGVVAKAEALVKDLSADLAASGQVYLRVFNSVMKKGKGYPGNEYGRLTRMLGGALKPEKADELTIRRNIVASFVDKSDLDEEAITVA